MMSLLNKIRGRVARRAGAAAYVSMCRGSQSKKNRPTFTPVSHGLALPSISS
jgi:hypothetical protein